MSNLLRFCWFNGLVTYRPAGYHRQEVRHQLRGVRMDKSELKILRKDLREVARGVQLAGKRLNEGRLYKMLDMMRTLTGNLNKLADKLNNIIEQKSSNV